MGVPTKLNFQIRDGEGDTEKVDRVARPSQPPAINIK